MCASSSCVSHNDAMAEDAWFAVRTVVAEMENQPWGPDDLGPGENDHEERITLWRAPSLDAAIAYAEAEAARYVEDVGGEALGFAQAYSLGDDPGHGVEVFSLIRRSSLPPERYIDRHFDTGTEHESSGDS
jgi:hypothetical protein